MLAGVEGVGFRKLVVANADRRLPQTKYPHFTASSRLMRRHTTSLTPHNGLSVLRVASGTSPRTDKKE